METAYNLAKVCLDERPCMILEPGRCPGPAPSGAPPSLTVLPWRKAPGVDNGRGGSDMGVPCDFFSGHRSPRSHGYLQGPQRAAMGLGGLAGLCGSPTPPHLLAVCGAQNKAAQLNGEQSGCKWVTGKYSTRGKVESSEGGTGSQTLRCRPVAGPHKCQ